MDGKKDSDAWLLVEKEKNLDTLIVAVREVAQNQQQTALALQKLLSGLTEKLEKLDGRFRAMQEKIAALEHHMLEKDIREQNRRLRTHDAFSFQARKMANP